MKREPNLSDVLDAITDVAEAVQTLSSNTDAEFRRLDERFVTKDEFKRCAMKDDLRGFATKDDLSGFATKDDLLSFATKEDLRGFATKDDLSGFATKDDLQEFKNEILDHVDWFATHHQTVDVEIASLRNASFRHEERITALEERAK